MTADPLETAIGSSKPREPPRTRNGVRVLLSLQLVGVDITRGKRLNVFTLVHGNAPHMGSAITDYA
eukprot:6993474-Lingulodinium_polyedra.AAC.1